MIAAICLCAAFAAVVFRSEPEINGSAEPDQGMIEPETAAMTDETVYILSIGNYYHKAECKYVFEDSIEVQKSAAVQMGFEPCEYCGSDKIGR